jgi:hypothetical protein
MGSGDRTRRAPAVKERGLNLGVTGASQAASARREVCSGDVPALGLPRNLQETMWWLADQKPQESLAMWTGVLDFFLRCCAHGLPDGLSRKEACPMSGFPPTGTCNPRAVACLRAYVHF